MSVVNVGTGPGLFIRQTGNQTVAEFYDDNNPALIIDGRTTTAGNVGIGLLTPGERLTVNGSISASAGLSADSLFVVGNVAVANGTQSARAVDINTGSGASTANVNIQTGSSAGNLNLGGVSTGTTKISGGTVCIGGTTSCIAATTNCIVGTTNCIVGALNIPTGLIVSGNTCAVRGGDVYTALSGTVVTLGSPNNTVNIGGASSTVNIGGTVNAPTVAIANNTSVATVAAVCTALGNATSLAAATGFGTSAGSTVIVGVDTKTTCICGNASVATSIVVPAGSIVASNTCAVRGGDVYTALSGTVVSVGSPSNTVNIGGAGSTVNIHGTVTVPTVAIAVGNSAATVGAVNTVLANYVTTANVSSCIGAAAGHGTASTAAVTVGVSNQTTRIEGSAVTIGRAAGTNLCIFTGNIGGAAALAGNVCKVPININGVVTNLIVQA